MKKQTLMFLSLGTLLLGNLWISHAKAQAYGCITRPGEICDPPRYTPEPPGYDPIDPDPEPPYHHPGRPQPPGRPQRPPNPVRPIEPDHPSYSFQIRIPINEWIYGYRRFDLGRMINLWQYQGFRILEVTAVARRLHNFDGYLELLLNGNQDSYQRVVYKDAFMYRLPVWGYRTIGHDVRWIELGARHTHIIEILIRLSRN